MTERYAVASNLFGYELHTSHLRFAVVDNEPDVVSMYSATERARILAPWDSCTTLQRTIPFRHVAFCVHIEDARRLAAALNTCDKKEEAA